MLVSSKVSTHLPNKRSAVRAPLSLPGGLAESPETKKAIGFPERARAVGKAVRLWPLALLLLPSLLWPSLSFGADNASAGLPSPVPYRTPLAGQGFRGRAFGKEVVVSPESRRSVSSWDLGLVGDWPSPDDSGALPIGSFYFWRHPDDNTLLRAEVAGVYDDLFYARSTPQIHPLEGVLTFFNFTLPMAREELIDGEGQVSQRLMWGTARFGFGLGFRRQVAPGHEDNMFAVDLTAEPGVLYFSRESDTADNFVVPRDTFEIRGHLQVRWDALERNVLNLPHRGFAAGCDLIYGVRPGWENWGLDGQNAAGEGRQYTFFSAYLLAAGKVPFVDSDRQRLIGSLHGGIGRHLDRFSAPLIGGGADPMGEEYGSTWLPVLPGAAIHEFRPNHYLIGVAEYRWEAAFFTYLSLRASIAELDRQRLRGGGIVRRDDVFTSLGAVVTTGFFFGTRLQIDYEHNFQVIRGGSRGGNEIVLDLSGNL